MRKGFVLFPLFALLSASISAQGTSGLCGYVMPFNIADHHIYRIALDEEPLIRTLCEAPYFASSVSALAVSADTNTILIFYANHVMLWDRKVGEHKICEYDAIHLFGIIKAMPSSGRYLVIECARRHTPGAVFAVLETATARLVRLLECDNANITSACFHPSDSYVYFSSRNTVMRASLENPETPPEIWLRAPENSPGIDQVFCTENGALDVYITGREANGGPMITARYACVGKEWGEAINKFRGRVFDITRDGKYAGYYDAEACRVTIADCASGAETSFLIARKPILDAMPPESVERAIMNELLKYGGAQKELLSLAPSAVTPDGRYCVFTLDPGMQTNGLCLFYDRVIGAWAAVRVGGKDASGVTNLAFPFGVSITDLSDTERDAVNRALSLFEQHKNGDKDRLAAKGTLRESGSAESIRVEANSETCEYLFEKNQLRSVKCSENGGKGYELAFVEGKPFHCLTLKDGKPAGYLVKFHENGTLECLLFLQNGKAIGSAKRWSADGKLVESAAYEKPKEIIIKTN